MPVVSAHKQRFASIICDCPEHKEAREASGKAFEVAKAILASEKVGDRKKVEALLPELERLNEIARQCD